MDVFAYTGGRGRVNEAHNKGIINYNNSPHKVPWRAWRVWIPGWLPNEHQEAIHQNPRSHASYTQASRALAPGRALTRSN